MKQLILDFHRRFETFIVCLLLLLLMLTVLIATLEFFYLFWSLVGDRVREMDSVDLFRSGMHKVFAGFLVLLLGIELMETVRMYLTEHVIHVEIVFLVAMIAVGRHVIELDYAQGEAMTLFGVAALVLTLSAGYFLLKRAGPPSHAETKGAEERAVISGQ